ncbi:hypothetical protein NDU88_003010, partial [Pleurodeles waltl]
IFLSWTSRSRDGGLHGETGPLCSGIVVAGPKRNGKNRISWHKNMENRIFRDKIL